MNKVPPFERLLRISKWKYENKQVLFLNNWRQPEENFGKVKRNPANWSKKNTHVLYCFYKTHTMFFSKFNKLDLLNIFLNLSQPCSLKLLRLFLGYTRKLSLLNVSEKTWQTSTEPFCFISEIKFRLLEGFIMFKNNHTPREIQYRWKIPANTCF